jgi:hypothetical protein
MGYRLRVNCLRKALLLLLVAVWLPAVLHCDLEQSFGLTLFACERPAETDAHRNATCAGDACATLESGFIKSEENAVVVAGPPLRLLTVLMPPAEMASAYSFEVPAAADRLVLWRNWQFDCRAASPPRAPTPLA